MSQGSREKLIRELAQANDARKSGRISRREFIGFLTQLGVVTGFSLAEVEQAQAWVATRMRKSKAAAGAVASSLRSLRYESGRNTYLSRTPAATGNQTTWTWSGWVKRAALSQANGSGLFQARTGDANPPFTWFYFNATDQLALFDTSGTDLRTTAVFRDTGAWMHVVLVVNTNVNTRVQIYVNGVAQLLTGTMPGAGATLNVNSTAEHHVGAIRNNGAYRPVDGGLSDVHFIDGQALSPWSFADLDPTTLQLIPKDYAGSYGTNGFRLKFNDSSSVAALGTDASGGGKTWTVNNHAVTDQLLDCPVNCFATWNPVDTDGNAVLSNGALSFTINSTAQDFATRGNFPLKSGKWYWEVTNAVANPYYVECGIVDEAVPITAYGSGAAYKLHWSAYGPYDAGTSTVYKNYPITSWAGLTSPSAAGDVVMIAFDADNGKIWWGKNGAWINNSGTANPATGADPRYSGIDTTKAWKPCLVAYYSTYPSLIANFGQGGQAGLTYNSASGGSFKYAPPTGFKALSTANLPPPAVARPGQYFSVATYIGNGGTQRIGPIIPAVSSYQVSRSLRFNPNNSAYLSRTPAANGDRKKWTFSAWVKQSAFGGKNVLLGCGPSTTDYGVLSFAANGYLSGTDTLKFTATLGNAVQLQLETNLPYRSSATWTHVVVALDTAQAVAGDRVKIYVDGAAVTSFSTATYPTQNLDVTYFNSTQTQNIGLIFGPYGFMSGYLAEVRFVDGQALAAGAFGQVDAVSGDWVPVAYGGAYGTNGFYLNFADNSNTTAATLGKDSSGNGNNFTPTGFSVAAGAGCSSVKDSPTSFGADSGGTTDNASGNYATWDAVNFGASVTLANGALDASSGINNSGSNNAYSTHSFGSGKFYAEFTVSNSYSYSYLGFSDVTALTQSSYVGYFPGCYGLEVGTGIIYGSNGAIGSYTGATAGQTLMIAVDMDNGKAWWGINGVWFNSGSPAAGTNPQVTGLSGAKSFALTPYASSGVFSANFGQRPFAYAPPAGFKCLSTRNLPTVSAGSMTATPDLVWIKSRSASSDHALYDSVRGTGADLATNLSAAETVQPAGLTQFTSTGFVVGNLAKINTAGSTYVAWEWKAGASAGSNNAGTIAAIVNAGTVPGFSIVSYTGTGTAGTVGHGLGGKPKFIIGRTRSVNPTDWACYHASIGAAVRIHLDTTGAATASQLPFSADPSATLVSLSGSGNYLNFAASPAILYCWSEVEGFSRISSYTGNGSVDGPFVWCGFRPRFVMLRRTDATGSWYIFDSVRGTFNPIDESGSGDALLAEQAVPETSVSCPVMDFLSNGFKLRDTISDYNASGGNYIFVAFAEAPYKYASGR